MTEIIEQATDWESIESIVSQFRSKAESRFPGRSVRLLYRGQGDSTWGLESSLQRIHSKQFSLENYDTLLHQIAPAVESVTEKPWKLVDFEPVDDVVRPFDIPNYEFMAYSRHHGFPTPLLDWTRSIYVALFFAFQGSVPGREVALYAYIDELRLGSGGPVGSPKVISQGEYIAPHRRHLIQHSVYTTCTEKHNETWYYSSHQAYFELPEKQKLLAKIRMPGSARDEVLQRLDEMNINAFTLYGSEEGLMEMLWLREGSRWQNPAGSA